VLWCLDKQPQYVKMPYIRGFKKIVEKIKKVFGNFLKSLAKKSEKPMVDEKNGFFRENKKSVDNRFQNGIMAKLSRLERRAKAKTASDIEK